MDVCSQPSMHSLVCTSYVQTRAQTRHTIFDVGINCASANTALHTRADVRQMCMINYSTWCLCTFANAAHTHTLRWKTYDTQKHMTRDPLRFVFISFCDRSSYDWLCRCTRTSHIRTNIVVKYGNIVYSFTIRRMAVRSRIIEMYCIY